MPEIYNSQELDGILNIKKRLTKNLKKTFADEEPFGLTVGDAKGLDNLVASTEDIETNAELVVSKLDKAGNFHSAEKQINAFYKSVRKGLNIVKNLKFAGLPRSDIEKLSNYLPSLQEYLARFKELFASKLQENVTTDIDIGIEQLKDEITRLEDEYNDLKQQERDGDDVVDELRQNEIDYDLRNKDLDKLQKQSTSSKIRTKNIGIDYNLILKEFTNFIQFLQDGIASFNAGRTTAGNLGGSYIGGSIADYQPRRFM
jgi:hypothetical protein